MKKLSLLLIAFAMVVGFSSCKQDDPKNEPSPYDNLNPKQESWAMCLEYTGSWCYYCGQWGGTALNAAVNVGRTVGMAIKIAPDPQALASDLKSSFESDRPYPDGTPTLYAGDLKKDYNAANYCQQLINNPCVIGIDASQSITDNQLQLCVKTKNFEAINASDYYIVAYLIEDNLHYNQEGSDSDLHNFVLRKASSGSNYYGEQLFTDGAANAEFTHTFNFDVSNYNKANCYAAVVIYKKGTGTPQYKFVNAFWTRK